MTSFRQIEANRIRTQEQRSEKKLANDDREPHCSSGTEDRRKSLSLWNPDHPNIRSGYLRTTLELPQSAIWCTGVIVIVVHASCHRC
jgi:hypothetical protein